jgi:hypothetical protein
MIDGFWSSRFAMRFSGSFPLRPAIDRIGKAVSDVSEQHCAFCESYIYLPAFMDIKKAGWRQLF